MRLITGTLRNHKMEILGTHKMTKVGVHTFDIIDWTQDDNTDICSYVDDIIISCASHSPVEEVALLLLLA